MTVDPNETGPAVYTPGDGERTEVDENMRESVHASGAQPAGVDPDVPGLDTPGPQAPSSAAPDALERSIRESGKWTDPDFSGSSDLVHRGMQVRTTGGSGSATLPVDTSEALAVSVAGPPADAQDGPGGSLPPTIAENPGGYGEWDELQLERRAAERRREDEREEIARENREWDEMVDSSLEMRDTPYSDLTTPEDVATEMGGVPDGDTDEANADQDAAGRPAPAPGPVARQAHEPHGATKPAEAAGGTGTSRSPAESVSEGRVPSAASSASSASPRQRETAKRDGLSDSPMSDRDAEMAKRIAEIDARVRAGAPVKPWNPVHIAKRAKPLSKKARQLAAAAGLVAVLAGLGICATANSLVASSRAVPAPSAAAAAVPAASGPVAFDLQPQFRQTLEVTPTLILGSGGCPGRVPLAPKTITNPQPGRTNVYVWDAYDVPLFCGGSVSVELDYAGVTRRESAVWTVFQPRTNARRAASGPGTPIEGAATLPPERIVPGSGTQCVRRSLADGQEVLKCTYTLALVVTNEAQ